VLKPDGAGSGTLFKLSSIGGGQWSENLAHAFARPSDGAFACNGMVADRGGHYYGATVHGGADDESASTNLCRTDDPIVSLNSELLLQHRQTPTRKIEQSASRFSLERLLR
jgi:hypothetical protein